MEYLVSKLPGGSGDSDTSETIGWRSSHMVPGPRRRDLSEAAGHVIKRLVPLILLATPAFAQCSGYGHSAPGTVAKVTAALANFPVVVSGSWSILATEANGGWVKSNSGFDICFSDPGNTTSYAMQILSYNATGILNFRVKLPSLSATATTAFTVWAGKSGVTTDPSSNAVWDSNFQDVYPLQESASPYLDVTSHVNKSTAGTYPVRQSGGALGSADFSQSFTAASKQYIQFPNNITSGSLATYSAWVKPSTAGTNMVIYDNRGNGGLLGYVMFIDPSYHLEGYANNTVTPAATTNLHDGNWHHVATTLNTNTVTIYVDGVSQATSTSGSFAGFGTGNAFIGQISSSFYFNGQIEEVRVSNSVRSAAWIAAEASNMSSPGAFVVIGTAAPVVSSFAANPSIVAANGAVTLSWAVTGATSISISPTGFNSSTLSGSTVVFPSATTTYTLSALGTSTVTATTTAAVGTGTAPTLLTGPTATGNSPSSLLISGTLDVSSSIKIGCGTASGGPYTYASTPTVYGWSTNQTLSSWWGVTSFAVAVTGLGNPSTAYYCVVVATNASGLATTSPEVSGTTNPPVISTPITVTNVAPFVRVNDQANGRNGMPANGFWFDGDTEYSTWADDGNTYGTCNDCAGVNGRYPNANAWIKWSADHLSAINLPVGHEQLAYGTQDQRNIPSTYTDGNRWSLVGLISVRGVLYTAEERYGSSAFCCTSFVKSNDHFATSIAPEHNTGPNAVGVVGGDPPSPGNAQYLSPAIDPWPVQHCQDQSINCVWVGGADGYTYWLAETIISGQNRYIMRCRIENMPQQNVSPCEFYNGTQTGDDGLYDSNWVTSLASARPVWPVAAYGHVPMISFLPDFNRYVATSWGFAPANQSQGAVALVWDIGPYVWSLPTLVKSIPRNVAVDANYAPNFPQFLLASYKKISSSPLVAKVTVTATGSYTTEFGFPDGNDYSPYLHYITLAARTASAARPRESSNGRRNHLAAGLDLFYSFDECSWKPTIPDLSPNGVLLNHKYDATPTGGLPLCDGNGMFNFGFPYDGNAGSNGVHYQVYTLTTPYTKALTALTVFLAFGHYPGTLPAVANECVLDKSDIQVCRNGTTANSWNVKVGTTTVGPFTLATDGTFAGLVIRWDGTTISVYGSAALQSSLPLIKLATGTYTGTLGTSALALGSLAGGTQPFYGTFSQLLVYSRALTDLELLRETGAIRRDMAARGAPIP